MSHIEQLADDFRVELEALRSHLDLAEPLNIAGLDRNAPMPVAWRLPDGSIDIFPTDAQSCRPVTCGDALEYIERGVDEILALERRTMERYAEVLVHPEEHAGVLDRAAPNWPWTVGSGNTLSIVFWRLRDLALYRAGVFSDQDRARALEPSKANPDIVARWMLDGLERHKVGNGWVMSAQIACLFEALPQTIRHAYTLRHLLSEITNGDAQRYLIEVIAPAAMEAEGKSPADSYAAGALAEAVRSHVAGFCKEANALLSTVPQTTGEADEQAQKLDAAFATYLAKLSSDGMSWAGVIRKASRKRAAYVEDRWSLWCKEAPAERFLMALTRVLWPEVERSSALARRREPARLSSDLYETIAHSRITGGRKTEAVIVVEPPRGVALFLPLNESIRTAQGKQEGLVSLRQVLDGPALRDYLAMSMLWMECGASSDGIFFADDDYILEMTGATLYEQRTSGRLYKRYATRARNALDKHIALFSSLRVRAVGTLEAKGGDPLVDEIVERRDGKRRWYAHSRLIVEHMHRQYIRIPRDVCRLDPNHVPIAIGLATEVRKGIVALMRDNKTIQTTVLGLADSAGVDLAELVRRNGSAKQPAEFIETAVRVATDGKIGDVIVDGTGQDAAVTIRPSEVLRTSYQPLIDAAEGQAKARRIAQISDHKRRPKR